MRYLLSMAIFLGACGRQIIDTPAEVVRFEGPALRSCTVALGWTVGELVARCGRPDAIVRHLAGGSEERCLVYRTEAQGFGGAERAPFIAACTSTRGIETPFAVESSGEGVRQIVVVYGLRSLPAESLE